MPKFYNCKKCPGYCCSYPAIIVTKRDLQRLARHFAMTPEETEKKYCRKGYGYSRIMRRKKDKYFGKICQFFDTEARTCTIYEARPSGCREYPGPGRCGYYDFLKFERAAQNDKAFISTTYHP